MLILAIIFWFGLGFLASIMFSFDMKTPYKKELDPVESNLALFLIPTGPIGLIAIIIVRAIYKS